MLLAVLAGLQLPPPAPELRMLHRWLDSWSGIRWIAREMQAQQQTLTLRENESNWTAYFEFTGKSNLPLAAPSGLATLATSWAAVQWAAWQVVRRD